MIIIYIIDFSAVIVGVGGILLLLLGGCGISDLAGFCVENPLLMLGIPAAIIVLKYLALTITCCLEGEMSLRKKATFSIMSAVIPTILEIAPFLVLLVTVYEVSGFESGLMGIISGIVRFVEIPVLFFIVLVPAVAGEAAFYYAFTEAKGFLFQAFLSVICPAVAFAAEAGLIYWMYGEGHRVSKLLDWITQVI